MVTKSKNTDYSQSAVNLSNPPEVVELYGKWKEAKAQLQTLEQQLEERNAAVFQEIAGQVTVTTDIQKQLKKLIEQFGSYQNIEAGEYALRQCKASVTYIPGLVRQYLPEYAGAVIEEVVNKRKVDGLLSGGLITKTQVRDISEASESYAYIIR